MADIDYDALNAIELDEDAMDVAIDRAVEAERAGYDHYDILSDAIKGYIYSVSMKAWGSECSTPSE